MMLGEPEGVEVILVGEGRNLAKLVKQHVVRLGLRYVVNVLRNAELHEVFSLALHGYRNLVYHKTINGGWQAGICRALIEMERLEPAREKPIEARSGLMHDPMSRMREHVHFSI